MKKRELQNLTKVFNERRNTITILKIMVLMTMLKKGNIEYPQYTEGTSVENYIDKITNITLNKEEAIKEKCDIKLYELLNESVQIHKNNINDIEATLLLLNNMTLEDIHFFINENINYDQDRFELSTPYTLSELIIKLLYKEDNQIWFDLGSGNGNFLTTLAKTTKINQLIGDEINTDSQYITKVRLYFANAKYNINCKDSLITKYDEIANVGYAHIPFVMRLPKDIDEYNACNKYIPDLRNSQNADWMFADRLIQAISDRGIILMTEASLSNFQDIEQRKQIVEHNLIEGIIKLPSYILPYTAIAPSIVIFNKNKTNTDIKFLDASSMCEQGRRISEINPIEIYSAYYESELTKSIEKFKIIEANYNLKVSNYTRDIEKTLQNEIPLQDLVVEIFRGVQIPASVIDENSKVNDDDKVYKLLSVGDIQNGTVDKSKLQTIIDNDKYERYILTNNDVLVSSKSTKIKVGRVKVEEDEKIVATGSILVIRCNTSKLNPIYLKTFLDSKYGSKLLESVQTGSTIISINASALMGIKIPYMDMNKQLEIATKYIMKLQQYKKAEERLKELEKQMNNIFEENI